MLSLKLASFGSQVCNFGTPQVAFVLPQLAQKKSTGICCCRHTPITAVLSCTLPNTRIRSTSRIGTSSGSSLGALEHQSALLFLQVRYPAQATYRLDIPFLHSCSLDSISTRLSGPYLVAQCHKQRRWNRAVATASTPSPEPAAFSVGWAAVSA